MRLLIAVALLVSTAARADAPLPDKTQRLVELGRVWANVKFFHPTVATKDIDWDAALVAAIPKVEAATTVSQYKAAVQSMLATLGDPSTRVVDATPEKPAAAKPKQWLTWPSPTILELSLGPTISGPFDFAAMMQQGAQVVGEAAKAKAMIIDLRGAKAEALAFAMQPFEAVLPAFDDWPTARIIEHHGFRTQQGMTSGDYFSTFVTVGGKPPHPAPTAGPSHVVFVVDADTPIPAAAHALQAAGKGTIVASAKLRSVDIGDVVDVDLAGGAKAQIRISEPTWPAPIADVIAKDPLARAREVAKHPKAAPRAKKPLALPPLRVRDDADYATTPYPSRERRLLAGIRLWAVIDRLYPYRYLIRDWDAVLREMLPRLEQAADAEAYGRVLREMGARIGDGHVNVFPAKWDMKTRGIAPFETRLIEGKLAVIRVLDDATKLGIAVGDVIETIDGKPVAEKLAALRPVTTGSTDEARDQHAAQAAFGGDNGSTIKIGVRDARGKLREIAVTRKNDYAMALHAEPTGPHWKKLPGNIGYVDLRLLTVPEVDQMFTELGAMKALVFDMRGYPKGTAWAIAPRINTKQAKYGAQFLAPLVRGQNEATDVRERFFQDLPPGEGAPLYKGKIVMLIDDRAISQSEHTCLFFQEAAGVTFVGSPTAGANGDITVMRLPGGLRMSFTGQEVRHVDGKQLQRVGIQPHVVVRPTLAGIRAGKDEVLDRALAVIAK